MAFQKLYLFYKRLGHCKPLKLSVYSYNLKRKSAFNLLKASIR